MQSFGIDISVWQKNFDFEKAIKEGVQFCIIKAGGADSGLYKDSMFEENYKKAKAKNLNVGAYWFSNALTVDQAKKEAAYLLNLLSGKRFEYPIFFDCETEAMRKLGKDKLTEIVKAFCGELEAHKYWAGFYTNYDWYVNCLHGASLAKRYSLWLAAWRDKCPVTCQMWQFGGEKNVIRNNTVAGVVCDQNYSYVDYPTLIKAKKLNGYDKSDADFAIEKLSNAGIINDPDYWKTKIKDTKHLDELFIKFAALI